ncbi:hypothetical protein [Marinobacter sp.]|uniref:hypothetical protein n=1 Tax=Marinobacter sp. TaxID=50741 RepID=UPI003850476F
MQYADSVQQVLIRKINRAEQDLLQLKLDYCRFIFGLTHRSKVQADGRVWQVRSVNVESMTRLEDGSFDRPELMGIPAGSEEAAEIQPLGRDWTLLASDGDAAARA